MNKKTTDIYFAAALLSLGAKLESTNKDDPRHMEFEFSVNHALDDIQVQAPDLDVLENKWVNRTLQVNAFEFAEAIKRMKSLVHSL